jgi:metallo-beta-lactamase family protein
MATLTCLGAAGTVTGSKHLLEIDGKKILFDCGLFQGLKELRLKNWETLPVDPRSIDVVVLTHGHLDHVGYLPRLVKDGFSGRIYATHASAELAAIILRDSGKLQEEDADFNNRKGTSKHHPALPLYTIEEAEAAAERIEGFPFNEKIPLLPGITIEYKPAAHILGSATVTVEVKRGASTKRFVLSGDLGQWDSPLLVPPAPAGPADYVMIESTYGNRLHAEQSVDDQLERAVNDAIKRGGAMIVPAFAVARSQVLLFHLSRLEEQDRIPPIPVYLDSPMAIDATELYLKFPADLLPERQRDLRRRLSVRHFHLARSRQESQEINRRSGPMIIISASGMATGGRVVHHLRHRLPKSETTILFVGYQSEGTRGARIQQGESFVRIFGEEVAVRAHVETIHGLSAHGDQADLMRWLGTVEGKPRQTFIVHGEPKAAEALETKIRQDLGWSAIVPHEDRRYEIDLGD